MGVMGGFTAFSAARVSLLAFCPALTTLPLNHRAPVAGELSRGGRHLRRSFERHDRHINGGGCILPDRLGRLVTTSLTVTPFLAHRGIRSARLNFGWMTQEALAALRRTFCGSALSYRAELHQHTQSFHRNTATTADNTTRTNHVDLSWDS